jgi:putative sterol carrier protein
MTWQGGKRPKEENVTTSFAPLQRLLEEHEQDPEEGLHKLAQALGNYDSPVRIHVQLLHEGKVEHWEVQGGSTAAAQRLEPQEADVLVVVRRETWVQIAQGRLSPFDALFQGKLRVGGNLELAKRLAQHLSDPTVPFVPPC